MPLKQAAKKALRQSQKRQNRNEKRKRAYKALANRISTHLSRDEKEKAKALMPEFQKAVDKAAKTGAVHKNKADRLKSRMAKKLTG